MYGLSHVRSAQTVTTNELEALASAAVDYTTITALHALTSCKQQYSPQLHEHMKTHHRSGSGITVNPVS